MIILTSASPVSQHLSIPYPLNPAAIHSLSTGPSGYAIKYPAHQRKCLCSMTLKTISDTCTFDLCSGPIVFPALLEMSRQKRLHSLSGLFRHIWIICREYIPNLKLLVPTQISPLFAFCCRYMRPLLHRKLCGIRAVLLIELQEREVSTFINSSPAFWTDIVPRKGAKALKLLLFKTGRLSIVVVPGLARFCRVRRKLSYLGDRIDFPDLSKSFQWSVQVIYRMELPITNFVIK
jgi:hypothetical protein